MRIEYKGSELNQSIEPVDLLGKNLTIYLKEEPQPMFLKCMAVNKEFNNFSGFDEERRIRLITFDEISTLWIRGRLEQ